MSCTVADVQTQSCQCTDSVSYNDFPISSPPPLFLITNTHACEQDNSTNGTVSSLPIEWVPSRGRNLNALLATASAQSQPSGRALPAFVPATVTSSDEHIALAAVSDPFFDSARLGLPVSFTAAAAACLRQPAVVVAKRARALKELQRIDATLLPFREQWTASLPEYSPIRNLNFPLMHMLCTTLEYPDKSFVSDLWKGMPIAGDIPPSDVLTPRVRNASLTEEEWRVTIPARNRATVDRLKRSKDSDLPRACWEKTLSEVLSTKMV